MTWSALAALVKIVRPARSNPIPSAVRLLHVVGARPNFPKLAPVYRAGVQAGFEQLVVHTGQHYDTLLSSSFFDDLEIPPPDYNLEVGSATHAVQTARIMERFEPVLAEAAPDWLVVYGDVNSTMATALVAAKLGVRIAHVEAGLRSGDRGMPEEINRLVADRLADLLLTSSSRCTVRPTSTTRAVCDASLARSARSAPRAPCCFPRTRARVSASPRSGCRWTASSSSIRCRTSTCWTSCAGRTQSSPIRADCRKRPRRSACPASPCAT